MGARGRARAWERFAPLFAQGWANRALSSKLLGSRKVRSLRSHGLRCRALLVPAGAGVSRASPSRLASTPSPSLSPALPSSLRAADFWPDHWRKGNLREQMALAGQRAVRADPHLRRHHHRRAVGPHRSPLLLHVSAAAGSCLQCCCPARGHQPRPAARPSPAPRDSLLAASIAPCPGTA